MKTQATRPTSRQQIRLGKHIETQLTRQEKAEADLTRAIALRRWLSCHTMKRMPAGRAWMGEPIYD